MEELLRSAMNYRQAAANLGVTESYLSKVIRRIREKNTD
ncbi:hypothetical protein FRUB_06339 [Fimbriiglobus ruber]|uniref:Uncharacterized protein n=1 Tax=Fimbriiglobus ruber TaxID=1908690 RepID=A0A225DDA6_9BACT|nr:hypothetical protein FRUB_06339 [Fimbriiglobus ruber]